MSLAIIARANNNVKPPQIRMITSIPGSLSVSPMPTAKNVGTVAQCNTILASHPRVSVEMVVNFSLIMLMTLVTSCSIFSIFVIPIKYMTSNFTNFLFAPLRVYVVCMIV